MTLAVAFCSSYLFLLVGMIICLCFIVTLPHMSTRGRANVTQTVLQSTCHSETKIIL